MKLESIFYDSFDTFMILNKLGILQASFTNNNSPKNIWQILNNLVIWRDY